MRYDNKLKSMVPTFLQLFAWCSYHTPDPFEILLISAIFHLYAQLLFALLTWNNLYFTDQEKKHFLGARLASGQDILCQQLIIDASYKIPTLDVPFDGSDSWKVVRGVCIISKSVKQGSSNVLVIFPPKCKDNYSFTCVYARSFWCIGDLVSLCWSHFCS